MARQKLAGKLVVDLSELTFVDSWGEKMLLAEEDWD